MRNVFVDRMVSPNLKAKAQGTTGTYDGVYDKGKDVSVITTGSKDAEEADKEKMATSVITTGSEDLAKAEAKPTDDGMCACEACKGSGRVAKATSVIDPGSKDATDEKPGEVAQVDGKGGKYDGTYGKDEKPEENEEDETPTKKAKRILAMKPDLNEIFPMRKSAQASLAKKAQAVAQAHAMPVSTLTLPNFAKK